MTRVVLASKSRARAALLKGAGVVFETRDAGVDETALKRDLAATGAGPRAVAEALAAAKAAAADPGDESLCLGADQTLDLDDDLLDKPPTVAEARAQLLRLRGRSHLLHSAVAASRGGRIVFRHVDTARLTMRPFTDAFLEAYLKEAGPAVLASVGAYQLEGPGAQLFEEVAGDYFTVLGLPLLPVLALLRETGALIR